MSDVLLALLQQHIDSDAIQFASINSKLDSIREDTTSLLESRSYIKGAWKAIVSTAATVAGLVSLLFAYFR